MLIKGGSALVRLPGRGRGVKTHSPYDKPISPVEEEKKRLEYS